MNRMVKAEALLSAQMMEAACVILPAADAETGGFANQVCQRSEPQ